MKASLYKVLAVVLLASSPGCALLASANAAHSRITPCVDDMTFSITDLVLAAGATGIVVGTGAVDESPSWMAVPGAFVTSGVVGSIFVHRCRKSQKEGGATLEASPAYQPVETKTSTLPDATPEELGLPPPPDPAQPAVRLQLDPDYVLKSPAGEPAEVPAGGTKPAAGEVGKDGPPQAGEWQQIPCGTDMPASCPEGTSCLLIADNRGYCVSDR